jgi:peroxiredoxin
MTRTTVALAAWLLAVAALPVLAGKYNSKLSIGDEAPDWSGLEGTDGKQHGLADQKGKVVVLCFTCNTCPYAVDYEERLKSLAKKFAAEGDKAVLVAINPNLVADDQLPAMKERAEKQAFNFLYLHDGPGQQVAKAYGIAYTPEFVVLDKERKVVYLGAMDDNPDGKNVSKSYVEDAVAAALAGKLPEVTETPAVGCAVRYVRERGKR